MVATATVSRPASARDLLKRRCEELTTDEMSRLARRVPGLRSGHLRQVEAALARVVDDLLLSRASAVGGDRLAVLFDLADVP
jgi:hypothetical protein